MLTAQAACDVKVIAAWPARVFARRGENSLYSAFWLTIITKYG
jgi:hypothetical protein